MTNNNISQQVYTMGQAAFLAQDMAHQSVNGDGFGTIKTGLPTLDTYLNGIKGTDLVTCLGRPSNGKTLFGNHMLMKTVGDIMREGQDSNNICVLISPETSVEITALSWMSKYSKLPVRSVLNGSLNETELNRLDTSVTQIMNLPLFIVGHSTQRTKSGRKEPPDMSPQKITDSIEYILNSFKNQVTDQNYEIKFIVTDYLNSLHRPDNVMERSFYSQAVMWAKKLAVWTGGAHWLNVQAHRRVDDYDLKIPSPRDAMETASVEHLSQVMFSTHIPNFYNLETVEAQAGSNVPELDVTPNLMYLALIKQQEGITNKVVPVDINFETHQLREIDFSKHGY